MGDPRQLGLASFCAALVGAMLGWLTVSTLLVPPADRFTLAALALEHVQHRGTLAAYMSARWAWLSVHGFAAWFTLSVLPAALGAGLVHCLATQSARPLMTALLGWAAGILSGYGLALIGFSGNPLPVVLLPVGLAFLGGAIGARAASLHRRERQVRGPQIRPRRSWAVRNPLRPCVTIGGIALARDDETRHVALIGSTGSGKSTAMGELMRAALVRGDRHIVADPDGAAMARFYQEGDIFLNPFDIRSARWDLTAEMRVSHDARHLAEAILPFTGDPHNDAWVAYAQQMFAAWLANWHDGERGDFAAFVELLSSGSIDALHGLARGTPAQRYFEKGAERMLASILGTLSPAIENLRPLTLCKGRPFSIRRWIHEGRGNLWLPYQPGQIASLRGLVSCWMELAISETMELGESPARRIWFHVDELDALGRIASLSNAIARLRKYGGSVVLGFQSLAQLDAVYGPAGRTIIENCGNQLILRCGLSEKGGTANFASDLIGKREIERIDLSRSRSQGKHSSHSLSQMPRRQTEDSIMPVEISRLPPLSGYLIRATASDIQHVRLQYRPGSQRIEPYAPR